MMMWADTPWGHAGYIWIAGWLLHAGLHYMVFPLSMRIFDTAFGRKV